MKNSGIEWIGEIPNKWDKNILACVFMEHKEKNLGLRENNLLSLSYGKIVRKDIETAEGLLPASFETYNIIAKDDIIFRLTDLQNDQRSLRTALCYEKGIITSAYIALRAIVNVSSKYMHYLFYSYDICKVFYGLGAGIRQGMNYSDLKKLPILIPPITEQQKIAEVLDEKCRKIDKLIENEQKQIEKMKEYKQSVITSAVTKGLDKSASMKDSGIDWIGEIPEGWNLKKLKQICSEPLQYGANVNGVLFDDTLPRYVRITDILDNTLRQDIQKQSLPIEIAKDYVLSNGDILFARSGGTVGKSFIFREHYGTCAFAGYLIRARISSEYLSQYIYYYTLSSCYNEWKNAIFIQSTIQNIGASKYANLDIPMPNYKEQKEIADYLDEKCGKIDEVISIKQRKIEKLQEYKKSLIYEYVTGKKEVV